MSDPEKYTVGWICAITVEATAAWAFLDEEHEGLESQPAHDNNTYRLGKIGKHNVVIALLPMGNYGTTSAASVARDMLRTFNNVRIGLMVGVGGGAPSPKNDIRLGDVVVGVPTSDGQGGILPYDFGKRVQTPGATHFQITGNLNQPPPFLLTAVNDLAVVGDTEGHDIQGKIVSVLGAKRAVKLRRNCKRPDPESDRLYRSDLIHPEGTEGDCVDICGSTEETLIIRSIREEDEEDPKVHYGLIASANQLMKDSVTRDELSRSKNVLCFEMEAAGLVNHFPCLIIRGICDYSDSHKNKQWQGYAAMTAAAYAKDLLKRIPPSTVESQKALLVTLEKSLNSLAEDVNRLNIHTNAHEESNILDWLVDDYYVHQHSRALSLQYEGTGQWFLESSEFGIWKATKGKTLLCTGIPGSGKTILTSIVTEALLSECNQPDTGIAYMYLDYAQKANQTLENLLAVILRQLAWNGDSVSKYIKNLYNHHKGDKSHKLELDVLDSALKLVIPEFQRVFIVIDAVDECPSPKPRNDLIFRLVDLQQTFGINLFFTSRPDQTIESMLAGALTTDVVANRHDLSIYLQEELSRNFPEFIKEQQQLLDEMKTCIMDLANGIFLVARLFLNLISESELTCEDDFRRLVNTFSGGNQSASYARTEILQGLYVSTMQKIQHRRLAMRALLWVSCTKTQLTTRALQHAIVMEQGSTDDPAQWLLPPMKKIISDCAGLMTVDTSTDLVRLVHNSAKQYFDVTRDQWFPTAEADITTICLTCISNYSLASQPTEPPHTGLPQSLSRYAASHWGDHARKAPATCLEMVETFLGDPYKMDASIRAAQRSEKWVAKWIESGMEKIHFIAYFGLEQHYHRLLQPKKDSMRFLPSAMRKRLLKSTVNCKVGDSKLTPLYYAILGEHANMAKLLLEDGADVNVKDELDLCSPLMNAVDIGDVDIVLLLLKYGAEVNAYDFQGKTALGYAISNQRSDIEAILRDHGAEKESHNAYDDMYSNF